jgi:hypothetical protein
MRPRGDLSAAAHHARLPSGADDKMRAKMWTAGNATKNCAVDLHVSR